MGFVNGRTVPWQGLSRRHFSVGQSKAFDFQSLQSALDAIADNTAENRYLITVAQGIYDSTTPIVHSKSYVDVTGCGPGTILRRGSGSPATGGTLVIGNASGGSVEDVTVSNLRVIRNAAGASGSGDPPEAALYVGSEDLFPATREWHGITLEGLTVDGVHDGVQCFGAPVGYSGETGLLRIRNCSINCVHDALTYKGALRALSSGNQIYVDSRGLPYLDSIAAWKSTGIHINPSTAAGEGAYASSDSMVHSVGDTIVMIGATNIGGAGQQTLAGFYLYETATGAAARRVAHEIVLVSPDIRVLFDNNSAPTNFVCGVSVILDQSFENVPPDRFVISGGRIRVEQKNTGASAPATVWGVRCRCTETTVGAYVDVIGTKIDVSNAKAGGNAYSLGAITANDRIRSYVFSSQVKDPGGAGTVTPWTPQ